MIVPNNTANVEHRPIVNNRQTNVKPLNTPADAAPINIKHGDPNRSCEEVGRNSIPHNPANTTWSGGKKLIMLGETTAKCPSFTLIEKSSTEHKEAEERRFSKRLAIDIATERGVNKPDVTVALVAETMYTWQNTRGNTHEIDGKPAGYQSAAGLQEDLPWMGVSTISDAILRLMNAFPKWIKVKCVGNTVRSFSLDERFIKRYMGKDKKDCLYFRADDADRVGVLKALLIGNLEYRLTFKGAPTDARGNAYNSISSATYLTKQPGEQGALPVFPYSRVKVVKAIAELKASGVFQKHPTMPDVYRVSRMMLAIAYASKNASKPLADAPVIDCKQTGNGCHQTGCPVTKPVTSVTKPVTFPLLDIEDRSIDREELKVSVYSARASHSQNLCSNQNIQEQTSNQRLDGSGCAFPSVESEPFAYANAVAKYINPTDCEIKAMAEGCKSVEDIFPGTLEKVNRVVEKYRAMLKAGSLLSVISPDEQSPFEIILDPVYAGWLELGLDISPITNKPIDYGDIEEQIDLAIDCLDSHLLFEASKKDLAAFRAFLRKHPEALDVPALQGMFERCGFWYEDDSIAKRAKVNRGKFVLDKNYFARRIKTLGQFVRYFHQLFLETYVGYPDKPEYFNGKPQRDWSNLRWECGGSIPEHYMKICAKYMDEDDANRATGLEGYDHLESALNEGKDEMNIQSATETYQVWQDDHTDDGIVPDDYNLWSELEIQDYDDNKPNASALVCGVNH